MYKHVVNNTKSKLRKLIKHSFIALIFIVVFISCKKQNNKIIINTSPLIYYTKNGEDIVFYNERFDDLYDSINTLNLLGIKFAQENKLNKSREFFLKGLEKDLNNVILLNNLGNLESNAKNFKKSIDYYKKSFAHSNSQYFVAGLNLARTLSVIGEDINAEKEFLNVINNSDLDFIKGISYYQLAENHLRYGEIEKGTKSIIKAKQLLNNYPDFESDLIKTENKLRDYYNE